MRHDVSALWCNVLISQCVCRAGEAASRYPQEKTRTGICTNVLSKRSGFQWQPLRRERILCEASLHCDGGERKREPSVGFNTRVVHEYIKDTVFVAVPPWRAERGKVFDAKKKMMLGWNELVGMVRRDDTLVNSA